MSVLATVGASLPPSPSALVTTLAVVLVAVMLDVESAPGRGTVIRVVVPLAPATFVADLEARRRSA